MSIINTPNEPIPALQSVERYFSVPIVECNEPVELLVQGESPKIMIRMNYIQQGIPGAIGRCFMRLTPKRLLLKAAESLPAETGLLIWDAWRPLKVQEVLFDRLKRSFIAPHLPPKELLDQVSTYVSIPSEDPSCPPPHLTGGSIDLTLCDLNGNPLWLGTEYDDFSPTAHTTYYEDKKNKGESLSKEERVALENRRLLFHTMISVGFTNYANEWWHFDFGNQFWGRIKKRNSIYSATHP